jgi:hypothetical protein
MFEKIVCVLIIFYKKKKITLPKKINRKCLPYSWIRMKVDTLNVSNLILITVPTIVNKNIKKICIENAMYLLSLMIENVNFFYIHCQ